MKMMEAIARLATLETMIERDRCAACIDGYDAGSAARKEHKKLLRGIRKVYPGFSLDDR
jgi:hypothetical protein